MPKPFFTFRALYTRHPSGTTCIQLLIVSTMTSHPGLNSHSAGISATPSATLRLKIPTPRHPSQQGGSLARLNSKSPLEADTTMPSNAPKEPSAVATMKKQYLISYNAISATLWFGVLARVVMLALAEGVENGKVYENLEQYTRLTQSAAGLEVVHSLLGKNTFSIFN